MSSAHPPQPHRITADLVAGWLRLSDDHNPLHVDAEFARARGFEGPVVPGALLLALACDRLQAEDASVGGPRRLRMRFRRPVPLGAEVQLDVSMARVRVTHAGEEVCGGDVEGDRG